MLIECVKMNHLNNKEKIMSKGLDSKKAAKKEPAKTLKEKRQAKKDKKANQR